MSEKCPALKRIKKMGLISVLSFGRTVFNPVCSVVLEFYIIVLVFILVLTLTEFSVYFLKIKCKLGFKKKKERKEQAKNKYSGSGLSERIVFGLLLDFIIIWGIDSVHVSSCSPNLNHG